MPRLLKPKIFIHTNAQQWVCAKVSEYTLRQTASDAAAFDIEILNLEDFEHLYRREGQPFLREGLQTIWKNRDLQSFTPLRFLPPELMHYEGRALVIDPDIFALSDICELLNRDMAGKAIVCRYVIPSKPHKKSYYASSVMLLDCAKLKHWQWNQGIDEMFDSKRDYRDWISLKLENAGTIGDLEAEWNDFDHYSPQTKLLHNTGRATQPWKTGLPIDFMPKYPAKTAQKKWGIFPKPWVDRFKCILRGKPYHPRGYYQKHPDEKQITLFFSILKACLEDGFLAEEQLRDAIRKNYLRADLFDLIEKAVRWNPRRPEMSGLHA